MDRGRLGANANRVDAVDRALAAAGLPRQQLGRDARAFRIVAIDRWVGKGRGNHVQATVRTPAFPADRHRAGRLHTPSDSDGSPAHAHANVTAP